MSEQKKGQFVNITGGIHSGKKGMMYYSEQRPEFKNKVMVRLIDDEFQPVIDSHGKPIKVLKEITYLKPFGFFD